jgi:hypothetical protein
VRAALVALLIFAACEQPTAEPQSQVAEQPTEQAPTEQPAPETPTPEPVIEPVLFAPADGTVYVLAADDTILHERQPTADDWARTCKSWRTQVELYNRDQTLPGPYPYRFVAGKPPN